MTVCQECLAKSSLFELSTLAYKSVFLGICIEYSSLFNWAYLLSVELFDIFINAIFNSNYLNLSYLKQRIKST